jgi:hypothetical protein
MPEPERTSKGSPAKFAQAAQRGAHGRLVHAQAKSCFGDAAFCEHGVQDPNEMEVYLVQKSLVFHTR